MLAYVVDEILRQETNRKGLNCWEIYLQEMFDMLGARGTGISLSELENPVTLNTFKTLIIGTQSGENLSEGMIKNLDAWVREGGILIGFALPGLDRVFGIKTASTLRQTPDDYAVSGYFDLRPHSLTHEIHPLEFHEQKLLILSDIRLIEKTEAFELAGLYDPAGNDLTRPAITWNPCGKGFAGYFAFDLAKTVWLLHQGKPLAPPSAEMPYPRAADHTVLGNNSRKVPYADEMCFLLQNMMARHPQPFIYQLPPEQEKIPDALLYWGGDEYEGPTELSIKSSDWMKQKGLGYHINMLYHHPVTPEELQHILDNGHEVSQYFGLHKEDNFTMKPEYYTEQSDLFVKKFGFRPICTVNKWLRWEGWAEPAKWMMKAGGKADNSFIGMDVPFAHPMSNGPFWGFGFGTSFPFSFYDDYREENRRIDFMEQPIICYEIGHRGSTAVTPRDRDTLAVEDFHLPIDMAVKYHFLMNMFYHPYYIAECPKCREAIEGLLEYIEQKKALILHLGNDEVWKWWTDRSRSKLENIHADSSSISFQAVAEYRKGMIIKIPIQNESCQVTWDGKPAAGTMKKEFGQTWLYIVIPAGTHDIKVIYQ